MMFQIVFPWASPATNAQRPMRRNSKRVKDAITRQWWHIELDSCGKNKTAIRLCCSPSDDLDEMSIFMEFRLYLKKANTILAVTSNASRFSRIKRSSEVYLLPIQFKDIGDDVKLSMAFQDPVYMTDRLLNDSSSCDNQTCSRFLGHNPRLDSQTSSAILGHNNASFLTFLKSGEFSDVIITVDGQEIKCHKLVLCWNSPYFCGMFKSGLKESIESKIDIVDLVYHGIDGFIINLYSSFMPKISVEFAKKLHIAADKYQVSGLKYICEQQLITEISTQNAMGILLHADIYSAVKLRNRTIKFILSKWKNFKDKEHYEALMTRPDLLRELIIAKVNDDGESDLTKSQTNSESAPPLLSN